MLTIVRFNYLNPGTSGHGLRLSGGSLIEVTATSATPVGETEINVSSVEGIKVGMFINHPAFVNDSVPVVLGGETAIKVIGVGTSTVELSHPCVDVVSTSDTIGFVSNETNSTTWNNYKSGNPSENQDDYQDDTYWRLNGERYGLDPQHAQGNGSFFIDEVKGKIYFSSNLAGKTIVLDYLSDGLGTIEEMMVPKLAEEAMYKWIAYAVISSRRNTPEYQVRRFKKEKIAEVRRAKLRISNIKLEEITQILRGKSKQIKH